MTDSFKKYHPIVNITYFAIVLLFAMFMMHPVMICISLLCALCYLLYLKGLKNLLKTMQYMIIMILMIIIINPMFNHEGMTILFYLDNGNPITKESIIYGIFMSLLFMSVLLWFGCYNEVMTSDKFVYLFGRIIPHLSLTLSMTLRYVPRFKTQFREVRDAQKCIGRDITDGNFFIRIKNFAKIVSIMISWSLENSIETADSMKSRGYGLPGRTAFSIFRFDKRDGKILSIMVLCTIMLLMGIMRGEAYYRYYPTFEEALFGWKQILFYINYGGICLLPLIINYMESRRERKILRKEYAVHQIL